MQLNGKNPSIVLMDSQKIGMAVLELAATTTCFWKATAEEYKASLAQHPDAANTSIKDAIMKKPAARVTWLCALFLLGYVGIEVALGGWIVEFMIQVRNGEPFASGMTATGFWLGLTIGRVILGFVTPKIGEKRAIMVNGAPPTPRFPKLARDHR
jgi:fucose permease